ncbi:MAG TPA: hypothetical protein VIR33_18515 [Thermopolyspora sp.]
METTLYRHLTAHHEGRDCALIVYRDTTELDGSNRRLGETGASEQVQRDTDRKWWPIAAGRRSHVKAIVYVPGGHVVRVRAVDPDPSKWRHDDRGYCDVPVSAPLTDLQIAEQVPTLRTPPRRPPPPPARQTPRVHRPVTGPRTSTSPQVEATSDRNLVSATGTPGPGAGGRGRSPARRSAKVWAECVTALAQLMEALVAERRPDRPVPPMAGTAAIGAVVRLLAVAIEEGRDLSSMSGIPADAAYRLLPR